MASLARNFKTEREALSKIMMDMITKLDEVYRVNMATLDKFNSIKNDLKNLKAESTINHLSTHKLDHLLTMGKSARDTQGLGYVEILTTTATLFIEHLDLADF